MFKNRVSIYLLVVVAIFLVSNFFGYEVIKREIKQNYIKDEKILFYKIKAISVNLMDKLIYDYNRQKEILRQKHKEVLKYLEDYKDVEHISLEEIYKKINKNSYTKSYNIYITDKNLNIVNTTYKPDMNFSLKFAEETLIKHKNNKQIGVSSPIYENISKKFFSYSDSFIKDSNRVLQVSYTYNFFDAIVSKAIKNINEHKDIVKSSAYVMFKNGYTNNIIINDDKKITNKQLILDEKKAHKLLERLEESKLFVSEIDGKYRVIHFAQDSFLFPKNKMLFSIVFSQEELTNKINNLNLLMIFLSILVVASIFFVSILERREFILSQKDNFISYVMHELKTPLSIITLNTQLRQKNFGTDKYSNNIQGALNTLKYSYDDISFLLQKDKKEYSIESINMATFLEDRIRYFKTISVSQNRLLDLQILDDSFVKISRVELLRLIDNNLSNGIKYGKIASTISIVLNKNILSFSSYGNKIKNTNKIFKKYERENNYKGGQGIGLKIVYDICKKYDINIEVKYENGQNIFEYNFCHIIDTSI